LPWSCRSSTTSPYSSMSPSVASLCQDLGIRPDVLGKEDGCRSDLDAHVSEPPRI
jgi:hypothetical protein